MVPRLRIGLLTLVVAVAPVCAASSGEADEPAAVGDLLLKPDWGVLIWTIVTFLLMAWVLGRFAWKPLVGALDARQHSIEDTLKKARVESEEAQRLVGEHKALVAQAHKERAEAVAAGQRDAEQLKAEILEQARQQREQLLKQTEEQVQAGLRQARGELRAVTADLAIQAAEKLLARNLDDGAHRKLVEDYLAELERSSAN